MNRPSKASLWNEIHDYILIAIAMMSYCIGWQVFLLPNEIGTGGVAGITSIIYWAWGIPTQLSFFAINGVLLIVALKILGWKFCVKTIYAVVLVTLLLGIWAKYYHGHILADQPFMAAIIGAVFCGCGVGLGLAANGSTGGTDIIAAIINKYRDISLGRVIMLCDVVIISSTYLVFKDFEKVLYGYVVLYVTAFCIDQVVNSKRSSVQFFIISDHWQDIAHRINEEGHRGVTVIDATGFYTGHEMKMLFVLCKRRQSNQIFQLIDEMDPRAFVSQSAVIGVYGEGFDHFKVRHKSAKKA